MSLSLGCKQDSTQTEAIISKDPADDKTNYLEDYLPPSQKWGMLNREGKVIIAATFDAIGEFSEGLCPANESGLWGFIDSTGTWAIAPAFKGASPFREGLAAVWQFGHRYNYVDKQGTLITTDSMWEEVGDFYFGRAKVRIENYWGYLDTKGRLIIPAIYEQAEDFTSSGARVKTNGQWGLIDTMGGISLPIKYKQIKQLLNGWTLLQEKNEWKINGQTSPGFLQILDSEDEVTYARSLDGEQWLLINPEGKQEAKVSFKPVAYLGLQRWMYVEAGKFGLCNNHGTMVTPAIFDQINSFSEGLAAFRQGYDWGYLDISGQVVISPQYGLAWDFKENLSRVATMKGMYFINKNGTPAFDSRFHEFRDFKEGLCRFQALH